MSLYSDLGGEPAVDAAVKLFYEKVLADNTINYFFDGVDMKRQMKMQKAFLSYVFGGPNNYNGKTMKEAHSRVASSGLNNNHFDTVLSHLGDTLSELGVAQEAIKEAAGIAETVRGDVLGMQ